MKKTLIGLLTLILVFATGWCIGSAKGLSTSNEWSEVIIDKCTHLTRQSRALQDEVAKNDAEIDILGAALKKAVDENEYLVQRQEEADLSFLNIAKAILEPEEFVVLDDKTRELTFKGFTGTLQWFAETQNDGVRPPVTCYSQFEGELAGGVAIEDRGEDGFRLAVPDGARAYSLKGTPIDDKEYSVDFMAD